MKTYISLIYVELHTQITTKDGDVQIAFIGGGGGSKGTFSTSDTELQKAIEADSRYNSGFKLYERRAKLPDGKKKKEQGKKQESKEVAKGESTDPTVVDEPTNVQQARNYIIKKYEGKYSHNDLNSREKVLRVAKELNIVFTSLPVK